MSNFPARWNTGTPPPGQATNPTPESATARLLAITAMAYAGNRRKR